MRHLILLTLVLACRPLGLGPTCDDHEDCVEGDGCLVGHCTPATCRTGADCAFGETCRELTCEPGCATSGDCLAGEFCDAGTCAPADCRDTVIDCAAGEDCVDGQCLDRPGVCQTCSVGSCEDGANCVDLYGTGQGSCLPRCRTDTDCPAAFTCLPLEGRGFSACVADCSWLQANGWL